MSKEIAKQAATPISAEALSQLLLHGNLKDLKPADKVIYYNKVCEVIGLNPLTKPFDYLTLGGKEVLYANKGCAEQLRQVHSISLKIVQIQTVSDVYVVVVEASTKDGRVDTASGAVSIKGLFGEALANAFMKTETKAKRRATLSICGLNMLDEMEVETIPGAVTTAQAVQSSATAIPKTPPQKLTRESVGAEIVTEKKRLKLTNDDLSEWSKQKTGKATLKELSLDEMVLFRDELQAEIGLVK